MKQATHHFCWAESVSLQAAEAKDFYCKLFGWKTKDKTMRNGLAYSTFFLQGQQCGALHAMPDELAGQGVPSHWAYFISTPNLDQSLAKANELGAEIVQPATVVENSGRIGVITDPSGALLHLWEAGQEKGFGDLPPGLAGAPCWFELLSKNPDETKDFYCNLFGWEARSMELPHLNYWLFTDQNIPVAGLLESPPDYQDFPASWIIFFNSSDLEEDIKKAESLGGKVLEPPHTTSIGRFSLLADPAGAVFALLWIDPNSATSK